MITLKDQTLLAARNASELPGHTGVAQHHLYSAAHLLVIAAQAIERRGRSTGYSDEKMKRAEELITYAFSELERDQPEQGEYTGDGFNQDHDYGNESGLLGRPKKTVFPDEVFMPDDHIPDEDTWL